MSQPSVTKLIQIIADTEHDGDFYEARYAVASWWEHRALMAKREGNASWEMWDHLGMLALNAEKP